MLLATVAVFIWAGNFVIARGVNRQIPPITLAFCRWSLATLLMLPIALKSFKNEWHILKKHGAYLFWVSLSGIAIFNTCLYISGHYTTAINMALISTTSSPIFATVFAGQDIGATAKAREYMQPYPPSSPCIALFKDGNLVHFIERHHIEGRPAEMIAENLNQAFSQYC